MFAHTNGANGNGARSRSRSFAPTGVRRHDVQGDGISFDILFRTFYRPLCAFACT